MPSARSDTPLSVSVSLVEGEVFQPGQSFHAIIEIRNRASEGRVDLIVTYKILDQDKNMVLSSSKTVAVETKASFAEEIDLPLSLQEGIYSFNVNVTTLDGSKWSEISHLFKITKLSSTFKVDLVEYIMAIALVGAIIGLIYEHRRVSKLKFSNEDFRKFIRGRGGIM